MEYIGIQKQQSNNNKRSLLLLCLFPTLILALVFLFCYLLLALSVDTDYYTDFSIFDASIEMFVAAVPYVILFVGIWFAIAYFANTSIIKKATGSQPLDRKENKRIYNLVENLCMAEGMPMPKVNIIEDDALNAFASGINQKSYTVTLTRGIINTLEDDELEAVIAHELSHIRNHDVRLLIVSIIFVGIFAMTAQIALRALLYAPRRSSNNKKGGGAAILLLAAVIAFVGYMFSIMMRFAISRKREYLADAGAAEMTKNPMALANALRKISGHSEVASVKSADVAQLFIDHSMAAKGKKKMFSKFNSLFATHPPIEKRIEILEQF